jgi:hypothetical protein
VKPFLHGVRGLLTYRDFLARPVISAPTASAAAVAKWSKHLAHVSFLDEATSLSMLGDFGIPASPTRIAECENELLVASKKLAYPLVLKTAMPEVQHKTEIRGVLLNIADEQQLLGAYAELCSRLGPRVVAATMAPKGIELILGATRDSQFGPVIMLGFGGVLAEAMKDVVFALPPFDEAHARRILDRLKLRPLLDGVRGAPPAAIDRFCEMAAGFSVMVAAMGDYLQEIDVNPIIVSEKSCIAVDALVVGRKGNHQ